MNLVVNGRDAMQPGRDADDRDAGRRRSPAARAVSAESLPGDMCALTVTDTGIRHGRRGRSRTCSTRSSRPRRPEEERAWASPRCTASSSRPEVASRSRARRAGVAVRRVLARMTPAGAPALRAPAAWKGGGGAETIPRRRGSGKGAWPRHFRHARTSATRCSKPRGARALQVPRDHRGRHRPAPHRRHHAQNARPRARREGEGAAAVHQRSSSCRDTSTTRASGVR